MKSKQKYISLVVDNSTVHILSSCMKIYDLIQHGVATVESVTKTREPKPEMTGMYFISPASIPVLINDFDKIVMFREVYLYFNQTLTRQHMVELSKCAVLTSRIRSLIEFNLQHISYESQIFHFYQNNAIENILKLPEDRLQYVDELSSKLLSFFLLFDEHPSIRYHSNNVHINEEVAIVLNQKLAEQRTYKKYTNSLLILDRTVEYVPLVMHDYNYQALCYDLLNIPVCEHSEEDIEDSYEYEYEANDKSRIKKRVLLKDQDEIWMNYKHKHISDVHREVREQLHKFANENAASTLASPIAHGGSTEDTIRAVRSLPHFQEMLSKYYAHVTISDCCYTRLAQDQVVDIGEVEQVIATSIIEDGTVLGPKKIETLLEEIMSTKNIPQDLRARLLIIYFSSINKLNPADVKMMVEKSKLQLDAKSAVLGFVKNFMELVNPLSHTNEKHHHKYHKDKNRIRIFQNRTKTTGLSLGRFEPYLKNIMQNFITQELDNIEFPYINREPETNKNYKVNANIRANNKDWNFGKESTTVANDDAIWIVYVIGGVTLSEMQCAYEVSRVNNCTIYLGGDNIWTPKKFLQYCKNL